MRAADVDDDQLVAFSRLLGTVLPVTKGAVKGHPEVAPVAQDKAKDAMAKYLVEASYTREGVAGVQAGPSTASSSSGTLVCMR